MLRSLEIRNMLIIDRLALEFQPGLNVLTGETGVGKNVVARSIHDRQTKRESFLSINCSAIPENLI